MIHSVLRHCAVR